MKIAFYHNVPAGGAKRVIYEQVKHLSKGNEIEVYEIISKDNTYEDLKKIVKVNRYRFDPENNLPLFLRRLYADLKTFYFYRKLCKKIAKEIDRKNFDIVIVHPDKYIQSPFILRYLKTPSIYYAHEVLRYVYESHLKFNKEVSLTKKTYENLTRQLRKHEDRLNINAAAKVLSNSIYTSKNIKKAYGINSVVCYPGVNIDFFKPLKSTKTVDVLFIGEKENSEGYPILKEIISRMSRLKIEILDRANSNFKLSDKDLVNLYNRSRLVLALSSREPFGLIPIEAMACGVPIIALNEGGYKETVVNGITGYLVEKNYNSISSKIRELLSDPTTLSKFGISSREHVVRKWSWEKGLKVLTKEVENLANKTV